MERLRLMNRQGFTLVELALVLVIVGLLITGVLKGEALIQNAKIKKLVNQKESISAAFYTFYDRYGMYPGDENILNTPTGDTHDNPALPNGQINGNEQYWLFEDLALAGIINGSFNGTSDLPSNAFGGTITIVWANHYGLTDNWCTFTNVPFDAAEMVDRKYDDGVYNTGSIRASTIYTNAAAKQLWWRM